VTTRDGRITLEVIIIQNLRQILESQYKKKKIVNLGSFIQEIKSVSRMRAKNENKKYYYVGLDNIEENGVIELTDNLLKKDGNEKWLIKRKLLPNTLIIANRGSINKVGIISKSDFPIITNDKIVKIVIKEEFHELGYPHYIRDYFSTVLIQSFFKELGDSFNREDLLELPIPAITDIAGISVYAMLTKRVSSILEQLKLYENDFVQIQDNLLQASQIYKNLEEDNDERFFKAHAQSSLANIDESLQHIKRDVVLLRKYEPNSIFNFTYNEMKDKYTS